MRGRRARFWFRLGLAANRAVGITPAFALTCVVALAVAPSGCAKDPTVIRARISADPAVPQLFLLTTKVARDADPTHPAVVSNVSQAVGDAADGRGPYTFPLTLPIGVPPGWSGPVTVTVDGLQWENPNRVIASAMVMTTVSPEKQSEVSLTLRAVGGGGPPPGDGGSGGDGTSGDGDGGAAGQDGQDAPDGQGPPDGANGDAATLLSDAVDTAATADAAAGS